MSDTEYLDIIIGISSLPTEKRKIAVVANVEVLLASMDSGLERHKITKTIGYSIETLDMIRLAKNFTNNDR